MRQAKIAKICKFWTFRAVIQLINHLFKIRQKALCDCLLSLSLPERHLGVKPHPSQSVIQASNGLQAPLSLQVFQSNKNQTIFKGNNPNSVNQSQIFIQQGKKTQKHFIYCPQSKNLLTFYISAFSNDFPSYVIFMEYFLARSLPVNVACMKSSVRQFLVIIRCNSPIIMSLKGVMFICWTPTP